MNNERDPAGKIAGMLGMARRAGRLTVGFDASAALVAAGKAHAVAFAADVSPKTEKELRFAARDRILPLLLLPYGKEELGRLLGLSKPVGVLAVADKGFAGSLSRLCTQDAAAASPNDGAAHDSEEERSL